MVVAYNLTTNTSSLLPNSTVYPTVPPGTNCSALVSQRFGSPFNPFASEENYVLSLLTLEELGATGDQVSRNMHSVPWL